VDVSIRSRNVEIPRAVRRATEEKVSRLARFLDGMDHADVVFSEEKNPRIAQREVCEVTIAGHGHLVRAKAAGADPVMAVDRVVEKLEHRLGKLKGKLVGRSHPRRHAGAAPRSNSQAAEEEPSDEPGPRIVKTKRFSMKPMSPEEAVLQMDLLGHDFFFFTNAESHRAAVVYRRGDGHVGLIEAG
jgi:putative sigma-54 modulation protein